MISPAVSQFTRSLLRLQNTPISGQRYEATAMEIALYCVDPGASMSRSNYRQACYSPHDPRSRLARNIYAKAVGHWHGGTLAPVRQLFT
jgi:hypothetical protein